MIAKFDGGDGGDSSCGFWSLSKWMECRMTESKESAGQKPGSHDIKGKPAIMKSRACDADKGQAMSFRRR